MSDAQQRNTELLAVSIDSRELLQKMVDQISRDGVRADYSFLSDPGHLVIDRYGLWNPAGRGWPHPTVLVIDKAGVVRWKFIEINYKIRPTSAMILDALGKVTSPSG